MKIIINGICGRMGTEIRKLADASFEGAELAAGADITADGSDPAVFAKIGDITAEADCIIDFSHHSCTKEVLDFAVEKNLPVVIATTGQTEEELAAIDEAARKVPVFRSANMSFGVALLVELAKTAAKAIPSADIEIVETHHNRKLDAPSGTALMIADAVKSVRPDAKYNCGRSGMAKREKNEIGIHAVRVGNVIGQHEVIVGTDSQTITLKHEAHTRSLFAEGAVTAAKFLAGKVPGIYSMTDMLK